ncbi:MAG TPA: peptidylprolyl isomerase [Terracidiphilus sp.]|nr:peptidylprolyl isomerase [Terracidiphilus sp.]
MIRFLQKDNRVTKAMFVVIIGAASVAMVVYLIPGLMAGGAAAPNTYAVVYPHWYSRFLASGESISLQKVQQLARQQILQRNPAYVDNQMVVNMFEQQMGQQLVQKQILVDEAKKLGIHVSDADVLRSLQSGPTGQILFPGGNFIGKAQYTALVQNQLQTSVADFEAGVKDDIAVRRLMALVTAPVKVSDAEVADFYRKHNVKIKFDYAVLQADDVAKTINPTDAELEAFFKKNAAQYAQAVPEERTIQYFAFTPDQVPGGVTQPTQQQIQQYYNEHQQEYQVPEQAKSRHILIAVQPAADGKVDPAADAAAKAKAETVLKQLKAGGSWTDLAKKYSDDPGSKNQGGELGFAQKGRMVPSFDTAIFSQPIGEIDIVKSQFGYHVVQVEARTTAHSQSLSEVLPTIQATLIRQTSAQAQQNYAEKLTSEAIKNGLAKTAAAHGLQVQTTQPVAAQGVIAALPDGSQLLAKAFQVKQGDPPQSAPTGEGYAVFQVTGITPAHAPSFADWKSHVLDDYRAEMTPALLRQKTAELASQAKATGDLKKAAQAVGAKVETSDAVTETGQVPDLGQVGQVAPALFNLPVGGISGAINTGRTGAVAKIVDKQVPTPDEIQKNLEATKEELLQQRQGQAFDVFAGNIINEYKKHKQVQMNPKALTGGIPGA